MDVKDFYEAIITGKFDDHLDEIVSFARDRKKLRSIVTSAGLAAGDRVRVSGTVRPLALVGLEGTVLRKDSKWVVVKLDIPNPLVRSKLRRYLYPGDEVKLRPGTFEMAR